MNSVYRYIVLRLAPDFMRGEIMNVGLALFTPESEPKVLFLASLQKLRAIDANWNERLTIDWTNHIADLIAGNKDARICTQLLSQLGYCPPGEPGLFTASSQNALDEEINEIKDLYINAKGHRDSVKRERRPRLASELRAYFKRQNLLGRSVDDLSEHLVVPNVPVPSHPDLKNDFVYKNGVYRLTQTLDYRVTTEGAHNKITEACTKSVAAQLSRKTWGEDTVQLAVVHVPEEVAAIADPHIDMLLAQGFAVFHATKQQELADYYHALTGTSSDGNKVLSQYRL